MRLFAQREELFHFIQWICLKLGQLFWFSDEDTF